MTLHNHNNNHHLNHHDDNGALVTMRKLVQENKRSMNTNLDKKYKET